MRARSPTGGAPRAIRLGWSYFSNHSFHAEEFFYFVQNPLKRMPSLVVPTLRTGARVALSNFASFGGGHALTTTKQKDTSCWKRAAGELERSI